eukprot:scaffold155954_cov16-Tisochrysis_lutea.AAC.2
MSHLKSTAEPTGQELEGDVGAEFQSDVGGDEKTWERPLPAARPETVRVVMKDWRVATINPFDVLMCTSETRILRQRRVPGFHNSKPVEALKG